MHIGLPAEKCREINKKLLADKEQDGGYEEEDFENLIFRYEEPNGMARWDSPLFTVVEEDQTPPFEQIWEALVGSDGKAKVVRPNQATVLVCILPPPRGFHVLTMCRNQPLNRTISTNSTKLLRTFWRRS